MRILPKNLFQCENKIFGIKPAAFIGRPGQDMVSFLSCGIGCQRKIISLFVFLTRKNRGKITYYFAF